MADPLWYKDAVIYEVPVRAFADSNGDGVGDFPGLTQKLPYLHDLGITCLWLLPFYASPLKDDGYDIADYTSINPTYGTLDDFKRFLDEAHGRGIRVLTELVINHTSDQHAWFQRARRAPPGSPERAFYVWSDTEATYAGTRIIFGDAEKSNWTFDPIAGQYYWHRFFSHQPDLNFDHPLVLEAVLDVMGMWLDLGVDALRLDAVPYLVEREGTINENLTETHDILKRIRRELDGRYQDRILLAEANQWPTDVRAYFGDGDECHMAFHFPLMPRMFMAVRQEERHPIVEILDQTPDIPDTCQWAIFLRNHDGLTLEMVTDEERDYMYTQYAVDPQARLILGIRRRLAPLMENSRPRIELMNCLLFSLPGTPVIYYGDEIGMGDNIYLGDRKGVRTPMQWTSDRNAGFSRADPARLYFPVIMDPVYGYESINVESQERSPFSLLQWMKRMIALRAQHQVFGRGALEFVRTSNRKVLTYVRTYQDERVLCVANLSRTVQPVEIPLSQFHGLTPVEMLGRAEFPRIGEHPYLLTLAPYGFYWFHLEATVVPVAARTVPMPEDRAAFPALFAGVVWDSILDGSMRTIVERQALQAFLARQRWFGGKARPLAAARFADWTTLRRGSYPAFLTIVEAEYRDGARERYALPLAMSSGAEAAAIEERHPEAIVARITGARKGLLHDGLFDDGVCQLLLGVVRQGLDLRMRSGRIHGSMVPGAEAVAAELPPSIARSAPDQSNTSVIFGWRVLMKMFRRLEPGPNPDVEIGRFLAGRGFARVPPLVGEVSYERPSEEPSSLLMFQTFLFNQGNGWQVTIEELGRYFERVRPLPATGAALSAIPVDAVRSYLVTAELLGRRTGELHGLLASDPDDPAFAPEPVTAHDLRALTAALHQKGGDQLRALETAMPALDDGRRSLAADVLARRSELLERFDDVREIGAPAPGRQSLGGGLRIRCHGDYHLGQVLITEADVAIIDFEGEPMRPIAERRAKASPLRDVAGMLRSLSYAALTGLAAAARTPEDRERLAPWADAWERWATAAFLEGYMSAARPSAFLPPRADDLDALLQAFVLEKALSELDYELNNRPDWVHIPLLGLLRLTRSGIRERP
jgi:maltose alpha-D-glucosyltransferase/alpha-amylase